MAPLPGDRLESWKEIAAYLSRGVRTVRRWEREEGLPVHRHLHHKLGSVYAFRHEIDAWRQSAARRSPPRQAAESPPATTGAEPAPSIAVLPFANLSTDPENEYFADGLTDEVTADLAKVRALRVISRTSSMTFRGTAKDVKTVARELGVRFVLEGSVRRSGHRLRITAQLIDAAGDAHVWADTFDGVIDDVFAFQERLARVIVEVLKVQLSAEEDRRIAERPIHNVHAYECYLRAREEAWRWRRDAIDHAVRLLQNGLDLIGDNAGLYAALGLAHLQYREAGLDFGDEPLREAEACARKVEALDPASPSGLRLRGWIHYSRGRVQEAVRNLSAALAVEPNNADTLLALSNCYLISGRVADARPLIDRVLSVDPLTPVSQCMPAWADILEGKFGAAVDPYRRMLEMDPENPMARLFYVWVLAINRRAEPIDAVLAAFAADVRATVPARIAFFLGRALAGDRDAAVAALTPEVEAAATVTDVFPRFLAEGFALAGMPDHAMRWLTIAVDRGFVNYPFLVRYDPCFAALRSDPRFGALMAVVRDRWERFEP